MASSLQPAGGRARTRYLVAIGIALFVASALIGSLSPNWIKEYIYDSFNERAREIEQAISNPGGYGILLLPLIIFSNNLAVSLIMLALFPTIVGPWAFMVFQGFAVGAIIGYQGIDEGIKQLLASISTTSSCSLDSYGLSLLKASLLIPHGIFEIPGVSLFMATSVRLSLTMIDYISWRRGRRSEKPAFTKTLKDSLLAIIVGVLLLLVAAFVESFVTPVVGVLVALALCSR